MGWLTALFSLGPPRLVRTGAHVIEPFREIELHSGFVCCHLRFMLLPRVTMPAARGEMARYKTAWAEALKRRGTQGIGPGISRPP